MKSSLVRNLDGEIEAGMSLFLDQLADSHDVAEVARRKREKEEEEEELFYFAPLGEPLIANSRRLPRGKKKREKEHFDHQLAFSSSRKGI